jgi:hypothetical protein
MRRSAPKKKTMFFKIEFFIKNFNNYPYNIQHKTAFVKRGFMPLSKAPSTKSQIPKSSDLEFGAWNLEF